MTAFSETIYDVLVAGGGVIGLSIARELAGCGWNVCLVDASTPGSASWAGAGILPPSAIEFARHPGELIAAESFRLHGEWARELLEETGIDNGFRHCGGLFVARTRGEQAALAGQRGDWEASGVRVEPWTPEDLEKFVPALANRARDITLAAWVPDEVQIRNPDHLRALDASCLKRGVVIRRDARVSGIRLQDDRYESICDNAEPVYSRRVCLASGAWTSRLLESMGVPIGTLPVRGQMLLYKLPERIFEPILYEGTRYLVPRDDGHVLAGSTLEQAGFDPSTTPQAIGDLKQFAASWFDELCDSRLVDSWAGLRPATYDGFPYIGPIPGYENAWAACGHFRSGLLMSTGTAVLIRQLINGEEPLFDLSPFRLSRG